MNDVSIREQKIEFLLKEAEAAEEAGDIELALQCYNHCAALEDQASIERGAGALEHDVAWVQCADFLFGRGDYAGAARAAWRALDCRPEGSSSERRAIECAAHHIIGDCECQLGNLAEAETALRAALDISEEPLVLASLGYLLHNGFDDRDDEARSLLRKALRLDPQDTDCDVEQCATMEDGNSASTGTGNQRDPRSEGL